MNTKRTSPSRSHNAAQLLLSCLTIAACAAVATVKANPFTVSATQLNVGNVNTSALAALTTRTYTVAEFDPYEWEGYWAFPVTEFLQTAIADESGRFQEIEIPVQLNRANPTESIHVEILGFDPPTGPWFQLAQGSVGNLGHYGNQPLWLTIRLDREVYLNAGDAFAIRVNAAVYHDFSWLGHYLDHYVEGEGFDVSNASYGLPQPGQPTVFDFGFRIVTTENLYPSLDHVRTWREAGEWYAAMAGHPDWTPIDLLFAIDDHMNRFNEPIDRGFVWPIYQAYVDAFGPYNYLPSFPGPEREVILHAHVGWAELYVWHKEGPGMYDRRHIGHYRQSYRNYLRGIIYWW